MANGADIERTSRERRVYHRNIAFGVASGALLVLADSFIHPTIVLALFVSQLTSSNVLVGLVPALSAGVWFLPQLAMAALTHRRARQLPFAVWGTAGAAVAVGAMGALGAAAGSRDRGLLLAAFFVTYALYNLAAGAANVPMMEVVGRSIPADRRAGFFGQRNFWGGLLAFLAGFVIQRVLGHRDAFPRNYALLFFAAFLALGLATYATARMEEPLARRRWRRAASGPPLLDAPALLTSEPYRRFLGFRVFLSLSALADPFFVLYARDQLGAATGIVGIYVAAMAVARFASNLLWAPLAQRWGNRLVLQLSALLRMAIPVLAMALPPVLRWGPIAAAIPNETGVLAYLFALVFIAYGLSIGGQNLANMAYLLDIAPEHERPAYVGLTNTVLGVVSFVPLIGGSLVDAFGFEFLFLVSFLIAFVAVFASGLLHEPRVAGAANLFAADRLVPRLRRLRG